jgi:hypothetical protein
MWKSFVLELHGEWSEIANESHGGYIVTVTGISGTTTTNTAVSVTVN